MKEHPILFSTPMVQAILEGRKTMTRRIIKNVPDDIKGTITWGYSAFTPKGYISLRTKYKTEKGHHYGEKFFKLPYGSKGDILWVRETYQKFDVEWSGNLINVYKADYKNREWEEWTSEEESEEKFKWQPSIFMPKSACRIKLEIANIKVERLHDITGDDIFKEGVDNGLSNKAMGVRWENMQRMAFEELWNKINKNWNKNPWVWVIQFKKL